LRAHFRAGEGCEVAALHRRAVARRLTASGRTGRSATGRGLVLPHLGIVVGYVACHLLFTRRPPPRTGANLLAGTVVPVRLAQGDMGWDGGKLADYRITAKSACRRLLSCACR